jgi:hypothetical protein
VVAQSHGMERVPPECRVQFSMTVSGVEGTEAPESRKEVSFTGPPGEARNALVSQIDRLLLEWLVRTWGEDA